MNKVLSGVFSAGSTHWVGDGFHVQNFFPSNRIAESVTPFLLMDYAGPTEFPAGQHRHGVDRHPHRGFETVTIALQGEIEHGDSAGNSGVIGPGDVQWMTAGSGLIHEEKQSENFAQKGGTLEMIQLWVNLRKADKMSPPAYQTIEAGTVPVHQENGITLKVIAGEVFGKRGPARTFTPVNLIEGAASENSELTLPWTDGFTAAILVRKGELSVGGTTVPANSLAVFSREGDSIEISVTANTEFLILGGEPIDEPTFFHGPFVMNSPEELSEAIADYRAGKMGPID